MSVERNELMKCPGCSYPESKVIDSRPINDGSSIKRRRECLACGRRFTTFEILEYVQIVVCKKDGSKELFDRRKLLGGVLKATQKRPVNADEVVTAIETDLQNNGREEVTSTEIGEMVMRELKCRDDVSYVRFASVYREFKDVDTFLEELKELKKN